MVAKLYRNWHFTLHQSLIYVLMFALWKEAPSRELFAVGGSLGAAAMAFLLARAGKQGYFLDRTDFLMHLLVTVDLLIEGWIYEILLVCAWLYRFEAQSVTQVHDHYGFTLCTTAFLLIIVCYRLPRIGGRGE